MGPNAARLVVVACAAAVLAVAAVAAVRSSSEAIATGQIYSTDDGDPVDVFSGPGDTPDMVCTNVGGFFYGSSISCFAAKDADETGSYMLVIPQSKRKAPLVVGVMPASARGATATVERATSSGETRGRWFLVSLEPGSLGRNNANRVSVEFE